MVIFYSICLFITILELAWLEMSDVRKSLSQFVSVLAIIISDIGYIYLSRAHNIYEAILAEKITRIAGCFLPVFFFFMVCEVCHINIKKWIVLVMVSIQTVLYAAITFDVSGLKFFKNFKFSRDGMGAHLTWDYGSIYKVYLALIVIYFIGIIGISIYSIKSNKSVNNRDLIRLIAFAVIVVVGIVIDRLMNMNTELMPLFYSIVMYGALTPIYNSNIYTVYENRNIINDQLADIGFIAFDTKMNYMGCDFYMTELYPELKTFSVGEPVRKYTSNFQKNVLAPIRTYRDYFYGLSPVKPEYHLSFELKGEYYDAKIQIIKDFTGKCRGFTMVVSNETEHHEALMLTKNYNEKLAQEVSATTKKVRRIQAKTILGMAQVVESRDLSTGGHVKRTSDVVRIFAKELLNAKMGYDKKFLKLVERSAPMHDIGKIGVDDVILRKQGRFTDEEYTQMKRHSEIGAKLVRRILTGVEEEQFVKIAENVAHYHHEKVDGSGYPKGLKGKEIPVEARIMAIADVFDALVSKRCYKEAFSYDKAFEIIQNDAGTHFDADLVKIFVGCRKRLEMYYDSERRKEKN